MDRHTLLAALGVVLAVLPGPGCVTHTRLRVIQDISVIDGRMVATECMLDYKVLSDEIADSHPSRRLNVSGCVRKVFAVLPASAAVPR